MERLNFGEPAAWRVVTLDAFGRDNADDPEIVRAVRELRVGDTFRVGGGAAPAFDVERAADRWVRIFEVAP